MHVVGARFDDHASARAALAELRDRFGLQHGEGEVRPLGTTDYDRPRESYLLAARLADHEVAGMLAAIRARGGEIVELRADGAGGLTIVAPSAPAASSRGGTGRPTLRPPRPGGLWSPAARSARAARARPPRPRRVSR